MSERRYGGGEKRGPGEIVLGIASGILAFLWGFFFFFAVYAFAGSDAHLNIAILVIGPVIATVAIFARRFSLASSVYVLVAAAELLRPVFDTNDSFALSALVALVAYRHRNRASAIGTNLGG